MNIQTAMAIAAMNTTSALPAALDPFANVSADVLDELRDVLRPVAEAGLHMEFDPAMPQTVGFPLADAIYRAAVATDPATGAQRVVILDAAMQPMTRGELHDLIRAVCEPRSSVVDRAIPATSSLSPGWTPPKSPAARQIELLEAIHAELAEIKARLP